MSLLKCQKGTNILLDFITHIYKRSSSASLGFNLCFCRIFNGEGNDMFLEEKKIAENNNDCVRLHNIGNLVYLNRYEIYFVVESSLNFVWEKVLEFFF